MPPDLDPSTARMVAGINRAAQQAATTAPGAPTCEERVLAAISVALHGPYCGAKARAQLLHPLVEPIGHNGMMRQAEAVLLATARAMFAAQHPQDLARICQAVEQALANWPPQFRALGDGTHHRPV